MTLRIGDKVVMNDKYCVSEKDKDTIWTVACDPWLCGGTLVVLLENRIGCYAVDGLDAAE